MRRFDLKGEWLVEGPQNVESARGRVIYPAGMRMAERGGVERHWGSDALEVRRQDEVETERRRAAREWLAHVEAGRIGCAGR